MSRTWKDIPTKIKYPEDLYDHDTVLTVSWSLRQLPTTKTKKRKTKDTEWNWLSSTPSWWTKLTMNRPKRRAGRLWEATVTGKTLESLEDEMPPDASKRPHIYYW